MQIKRGLFRLWIVLASIWFAGGMILAYSEFQSGKRLQKVFFDSVARGAPMNCKIARGTLHLDYKVDDGLCWYQIQTLRKLYPEYATRSDGDLIAFLKNAGNVRDPILPDPWRSFWEIVMSAVLVPAGFLAFGAAMFWAFAGFKGKPET